jgi:hypothetical protein
LADSKVERLTLFKSITHKQLLATWTVMRNCSYLVRTVIAVKDTRTEYFCYYSTNYYSTTTVSPVRACLSILLERFPELKKRRAWSSQYLILDDSSPNRTFYSTATQDLIQNTHCEFFSLRLYSIYAKSHPPLTRNIGVSPHFHHLN